MITYKSDEEIKLMKEAGRIVALAHQEVAKHIRANISTLELDEIIEKVIYQNQATPSFKYYNGFPKSTCISVNEELVHGIPKKDKILKDGDIVSIDIGALFQGYHGDSAWTYPVGDIDDTAKKLLEVGEKALYIGLDQVKADNRVGDISNAIEEFVKVHKYSIPINYTGHGIGKELHEDPIVANVGKKGFGIRLKKGMTIAVEPMIHLGSPHTEVLLDDWTVVTKDRSLCCHFEHTVLVTENGYEILTKLGGN